MSSIDDIKSRVDILDLAAEAGVKLRRSGRNYTGFCPFHENKRTPAFVVWPESGTYGRCAAPDGCLGSSQLLLCVTVLSAAVCGLVAGDLGSFLVLLVGLYMLKMCTGSAAAIEEGKERDRLGLSLDPTL